MEDVRKRIRSANAPNKPAAGKSQSLPADTRLLVQRLMAKPEHNGSCGNRSETRWSQASYCRWTLEQPAWLTPGLREKILDDCIPKLRFVYELALVHWHKGVRGLDGDLD